jgi:hypothetical protein
MFNFLSFLISLLHSTPFKLAIHFRLYMLMLFLLTFINMILIVLHEICTLHFQWNIFKHSSMCNRIKYIFKKREGFLMLILHNLHFWETLVPTNLGFRQNFIKTTKFRKNLKLKNKFNYGPNPNRIIIRSFKSKILLCRWTKLPCVIYVQPHVLFINDHL